MTGDDHSCNYQQTNSSSISFNPVVMTPRREGGKRYYPEISCSSGSIGKSGQEVIPFMQFRIYREKTKITEQSILLSLN